VTFLSGAYMYVPQKVSYVKSHPNCQYPARF
jgi:hypothetical protein